jgi:hypothetical protein
LFTREAPSLSVQSPPVQRHHPSTKQVNARASIHGLLEHFQSVDLPEMIDVQKSVQARRRGRPPKVKQRESEFVKWWKPGWKEQFR